MAGIVRVNGYVTKTGRRVPAHTRAPGGWGHKGSLAFLKRAGAKSWPGYTPRAQAFEMRGGFSGQLAASGRRPRY